MYSYWGCVQVFHIPMKYMYNNLSWYTLLIHYCYFFAFPQAPYSVQLPPNMQLGGSFELGGTGGAPDELMMVDTVGSLFSPHHPHHPPTLHKHSSLRRKTSSSSSDDTGQQPSSPTKLASVATEAGTSSGSGGILSSAMAPLNPILSTSVSLFL